MKITQQAFRKAIGRACQKNGVRFWRDELHFTMSNENPDVAIAVHFRVFHKHLLGTTTPPGFNGNLTKADFNYADIVIRLTSDVIERSLKPRQIKRDNFGNAIGVKNAKALRIIAYKAVHAVTNLYEPPPSMKPQPR